MIFVFSFLWEFYIILFIIPIKTEALWEQESFLFSGLWASSSP